MLRDNSIKNENKSSTSEIKMSNQSINISKVEEKFRKD